nr:LuxR C-terminal-related transcriptional regulator [Pseudomonas alkylphenolica]
MSQLNTRHTLPAGLARLAPGHVPRPRLSEALLNAHCRLRLLCAPVGSGKSALLSECVQHCPAATRVVYLNLRGKAISGDTFLQQLANALGVAGHAAAQIREHLDATQSELWLMIDDYPRLPDAALDALLNDLILSTSAQVNWWLACRRRPALQLTRLLLDADLFELGSAELGFNEQELGELLQRIDRHWPWPAISDLRTDSQGWCAGIRLYLLALKSTTEPQPFNSAEGLMFQYLRRELLDELPEQWRQALFTLAQLPYFDAGLCEHLLGVGEGAGLLEQLSTCGLFIEPVGSDGQVYQVCVAVRGALAGELPENLAKAVFRKACQWYVSQGNVRLALEYAVRADQPEMAASLMQRFTGDALLQGRSLAQLMQWRRELPGELLVSTPRLLILNAWALLLSGRLDEAQVYTEQLARFLPQPDALRQFELIAQWKALRGNIAFHRGQGEQALHWLTEAVEELPERSWSQRLFSTALLVEMALIDGRLDEALELNRDATKQARQHASLAMESVMALGHVKLLELRGELLRAETLLKRLYTELSAAWGAEASPMRGRVQLRQASILVQLGRYQEAETVFQAGMQECQFCGDLAAFWGLLGLAELDGVQGDLTSAFTRISDAERAMQYNLISESIYQGQVLRAKARLWLRQGRTAQVEKALNALPAAALEYAPYGAPDLHLRLYLLQLQASLAGGAVEAPLDKLTQLHERARSEGRRALACEAGFSLAEALHADNKPAQAKQMLLETLAQARQMGLVSAERAFALRNPALARWAGEANSNEGEPAALLSRREMDVLKLIAQGFSNQQIAESLFISLHTVKTHAQRINFKLGVERRTQAVARAKELGLN